MNWFKSIAAGCTGAGGAHIFALVPNWGVTIGLAILASIICKIFVYK